MRAIIINEFGGPDVMHEGDLPLPQPGLGAVRVKIACADLNPAIGKRGKGGSPNILPTYFLWRNVRP